MRECGEVLVADGVNRPPVESRRRERRRGGVRDRYDAVEVERGSAHFVNHPWAAVREMTWPPEREAARLRRVTAPQRTAPQELLPAPCAAPG